MVSNETVEEYFQLRESLRPFLEKKMGLNSNCSNQRTIEAIEQLIDFEDHLVTNDPRMLNECAEMIFIAKAMLQKHISQNGGKRYLSDDDVRMLEKKLV